jgi:peptidoglycan/LPS O-acetylase OafA/YrhL
MTSKLYSEAESPTELHRRRVFRVRMWIAAGAFLLTNMALYQWGDHAPTPWKLVLALLPMLALIAMIVVVIVRVREMDEYQVKLLLPGLAVGFAVTILAAVSLNTLSVAGFPVPNNGSFVSLVGVAAWAVVSAATGAFKA